MTWHRGCRRLGRSPHPTKQRNIPEGDESSRYKDFIVKSTIFILFNRISDKLSIAMLLPLAWQYWVLLQCYILPYTCQAFSWTDTLTVFTNNSWSMGFRVQSDQSGVHSLFYLSTVLLSLCKAAVFNIVLLTSDAPVIQPSLIFMLHTTHYLFVHRAHNIRKAVEASLPTCTKTQVGTFSCSQQFTRHPLHPPFFSYSSSNHHSNSVASVSFV
jgi:hypothetical protein